MSTTGLEPAPTPTSEELADRVSQGVNSAFSFRGTYSLDLVANATLPRVSDGGQGPVVSLFDSYEVAFSGPRRMYRRGPQPSGPVVNPRRLWAAFDGQKGLEASFFTTQPELTAKVEITNTIPLALRQTDFLCFVAGFDLFAGRNVAAVLKLPTAKVAGLEELGGRPCWKVVVEGVSPPGVERKNRGVIWIDPAAGYLPAKVSLVPEWIERAKAGEAVTMREGDLSRYMLVEEWGTVRDHAAGEDRPFPKRAVVAMNGSPMARLQLISGELNGALPAKAFEPETQPTTTVVDRRRRDGQGGYQQKLVGGAKAEADARKLLAASRIQPAGSTVVVERAGAGGFGFSWWLVAVCGCGLTALIWWRVVWSNRRVP